MILLLDRPSHTGSRTRPYYLYRSKERQTYTTPVIMALTDIIYIVSQADRTWWRNLRGSC